MLKLLESPTKSGTGVSGSKLIIFGAPVEAGSAVAVTVGVALVVAVGVGVTLVVAVTVGVGVGVGVALVVAVDVGVGVGVGVALVVAVAVGVGVGVGVALVIAVAVGAGVGVSVALAVGVAADAVSMAPKSAWIKYPAAAHIIPKSISTEIIALMSVIAFLRIIFQLFSFTIVQTSKHPPGSSLLPSVLARRPRLLPRILKIQVQRLEVRV